MESIITTFGINWKLLLSQAVNFFILFVVLKYTAYGPLLQIMAERRKKIELGLEKAKEADERLTGIHKIELEKTQEADAKALAIIRKAEKDAKAEGQRLIKKAEEKERELLLRAEERARGEREAALETVRKEAAALVKHILVKTVEVRPEAIDDALIAKVAATASMKK